MADNGDVYVIDIQAKLTNKIKDTADAAEKDIDRLGKAVERTQKQLDKLSKMDADLSISADDKATAKINRAKKTAEIFGRATVRTVIDADDRATKKMQQADKEARKLRNQETKIMLTAQDKASKVLKSAEKQADKLTKQAIKMRMEAKDQASPVIDKVNKKANALTSKAEKIMITAEDKASAIIDKAKSKADALSNMNPKTTLNAVDRASHTIGNVLGAAKSFGGHVFKATLSIVDDVTKPLQYLKDQIFSIKGLITGLATGVAAQQLVVNPISLADTYEQSLIGFETMMGDTENAKNLMDEIQDFAKKTPFDMVGVIQNAQALLTNGFSGDELIPWIEKLGNATAATGGDNSKMSAMITAMTQVRNTGRLNGQDAMQFINASVPIWQYLADYYGKSITEVREMSEQGKVSAEDTMNALSKGLEQFDGMMEKTSNRTVKGLLSNIKDAFDSSIVLKWGQGLQKGATKGFGKFVEYLDEIDPKLQEVGTSLEKMGEVASTWVFDKLEGALKRLKEVIGTDEFKDADWIGKIRIAWDAVIGDPLSKWWDEKGLALVEGYAAKIGKGLGEAMKGGLLALLGVDIEGAASDGAKIGKSFADGFLAGFDPDTVGAAVKTAFGGMVSSSAKILPGNEKPTAGSWVSAGILTYLASKLGLGKAIGWGAKGIGKLIAGFGTEGGTALSLGSFFGSAAKGTGLMGLFGKVGAALGTGTGTAAGTAGGAALGGGSIFGGILGGLGLINGGWDLFKGVKASNAGDAEEAEKRYWRGGTKIGMVASGAGSGAGIGALIGSLGGPVGAGAGALIGAGIGGAGALFGGNSVGDWLRETYTGLNEKAGGGLWKSLLAGAGTGAAAGTVFGPIGTIGGGVVGAVAGGAADVFGDDISKFFTETVPEAWNTFWTPIGNFFTETIPTAYNSFKEKAGKFFTETIPQKWNEFWEPIGNFFTETIPAAVSSFGDKVGIFFTETIPEKWNEFWEGVGDFFTETVPYALGYAAGRVYSFFTETVPEKWNEFWDGVGDFFTETVPAAIGYVCGVVGEFFTETLLEAWNAFWEPIGEFFTETVPEVAGELYEKAATFFTETIPQKWNELWEPVANFFTETIPEVTEIICDKVYTFFAVTLPGKVAEIWNGITNFFTEQLPAWITGITNGFTTFFTVTVPAKFNEFWDGISTFVTDTLPSWIETITGGITTFFTETVAGWFSSVWSSAKEKWEKVKGSFLSGWGDGKEDGSKGNNAHGGVVQSKMLSWLGEEGPEAVIPLNPARRDRALSLWMQTGQRLGVAAHANGGIVGESRSNGSNILYTPYYKPAEADSSGDSTEGNRYTGLIDGSVREAITARVSSAGGGYSVQVTIQGINFNVSAGSADPESIIATIRANSDEFTDMMADMLEAALREAFQNIPKAS